MDTLKLGDIEVEVLLKDIKNIHLSVYPPAGRVKISAPLKMELDKIRVYAISRLSWIKKQRAKIQNQEREAPREYLSRETHYFRGKRYLLKIIEKDGAPVVYLKHSTIELHIRSGSTLEKRKHVLDEWYRAQLKAELPAIIQQWEKKLNVTVNEFGIKKMRTKWGTCNQEARRIWLNLELAKKPPECLEYIVVHEMVHLLERNHDVRFISLMDKNLPKWRFFKDQLNHLPVKHEEWHY